MSVLFIQAQCQEPGGVSCLYGHSRGDHGSFCLVALFLVEHNLPAPPSTPQQFEELVHVVPLSEPGAVPSSGDSDPSADCIWQACRQLWTDACLWEEAP